MKADIGYDDNGVVFLQVSGDSPSEDALLRRVAGFLGMQYDLNGNLAILQPSKAQCDTSPQNLCADASPAQLPYADLARRNEALAEAALMLCAKIDATLPRSTMPAFDAAGIGALAERVRLIAEPQPS